MSEKTDEPLSFDRAEPTEAPEAAQVPSCAACKRALGEEYFTLNENPICEDCHHLVSHQLKESKTFGAFVRAAGFGAAAALGGSIAWYAVARITGMEIGLIAIAVGYMVGRSVRRGSRGPGGRRYQVLAMALTYLSITGSYVPTVMKSMSEIAAKDQAKAAASASVAAAPSTSTTPSASDIPSSSAPPSATSPSATTTPPTTAPATPPPAGVIGWMVGFIAVFIIALIAPFLGGASNILGLVLIAIALYEAWKLNRAVPFILDGPRRTPKREG
jgi:hypothetical protein